MTRLTAKNFIFKGYDFNEIVAILTKDNRKFDIIESNFYGRYIKIYAKTYNYIIKFTKQNKPYVWEEHTK